MIDRLGRKIDYLRISVTDRCNYRCFYCLPPEGVPLKPHKDILSLEEIYEVAKYGASHGMTKIKITGGEPLLRRNLLHLIRLLASIPEIKDLGMTTNASLLAPVAVALKEAGLQRVNISLDTLDPERFAKITRGGDLEDVLVGIDAALKTGLIPVKLNAVIIPGVNEDEKGKLRAFAAEKGVAIRFIPAMDLANGHRTIVEGGTGGICEICNRLRLSADGKLQPCLFSDLEYDVREMGIPEAFRRALAEKPDEGICPPNRPMIQIGG
jgi:cyclic pyranopterin phosphate synthase